MCPFTVSARVRCHSSQHDVHPQVQLQQRLLNLRPVCQTVWVCKSVYAQPWFRCQQRVLLLLLRCVCGCSKRNQLGDFYAWNACLSHILNLAKVSRVCPVLYRSRRF